MTITEIIFLGVLVALAFLSPGEVFDVSEENSAADDRLTKMWTQQESFMRLLQEKRGFPDFPTDISSKAGQKFLKDISHHIMDELFEATQHLKNAKSHRATLVPEIDREAFKEELVDALHLYFELAIAAGISLDELIQTYMKKGEVNFERIRGGY